VYSNAEHTPQLKGIYMQQAKFPRLREAFYYAPNQTLHTHLPLDLESPLSLISLNVRATEMCLK